MLQRALTVVLLILASLPAHVAAKKKLKIKSKGSLGLEVRGFWPDKVKATNDVNAAMVGRLELDAKYKPFRLHVRAFGRYDETDRPRSAIIPEEAWAEFRYKWLRIRAGFQLLNWTATEAFHPADVINARYFDSSIENPEKYGELMLAVRVKMLKGSLEAYFMPMPMDPKFPTPASRFNFAPPGIVLGDPMRVNLAGDPTTSRFMPNWGANLAQTFGSADISIQVVQHTDRQLPLIFFDLERLQPRPVFQPFWQVAATYQQAVDAYLLKAEFAQRFYRHKKGSLTAPDLPDRDHTTLAVGLEYGIAHEGGSESTFIFESQVILGFPDLPGSVAPLFNNDVLVAYRYAFNDTASRVIFFSYIFDVKHAEQFFVNLSYEQRLGDTWGLKGGIRIVHLPPADPGNPVGFENLHAGHQLYGSLIRYF